MILVVKQRRDIVSSSVLYANQCAVNAALNGRILIIEGIEKAERNLLPILNNLLENRELNLDDGHFLVAPERYDKLASIANQDELSKLNLLRVHEDFRVIALGLPVPKVIMNVMIIVIREIRNLLKKSKEIPFFISSLYYLRHLG